MVQCSLQELKYICIHDQKNKIVTWKILTAEYEKVITITLEIELPLKEYDENLPDCEGRLIYIEFERSRNDAKEIVSSFMKFFQIRRKSRHVGYFVIELNYYSTSPFCI